MTKENMVVGQVLSPDWLKKRNNIMAEIDRQLLQGIIQPGMGLTPGQLQMVTEHKNPFEPLPDWLQTILNQERQYHLDFFGTEFNLSGFAKTLKKYGKEEIEEWHKLLCEPHFLPLAVMTQDAEFRGWKVKPENWFYEQIRAGNIFRMVKGRLVVNRQAHTLRGITVLVDIRLKPQYSQMYEDDWLGPIIKQLRQDGKIEDFGRRASRSNVSAQETELVKIEAANLLGLKSGQIRLEREIEANVIPQLYPHMPRKDDGKTNTWEWREEYFGGRGDRLFGGCSGNGGLAGVGGYSASDRWYYGAFRFLAVL